MGDATLTFGNRPPHEPSRAMLRPAALADIGAVMAIERSPDYELYVARSEEEEHRAMLSSPSHAYRLGIGGRRDRGLRHLRGLGDAHANLYLKRIAVARPDRAGHGVSEPRSRRGVRANGAERFHLDCFADNARAQPPIANSASPATASCARPTGWRTGRARTS